MMSATVFLALATLLLSFQNCSLSSKNGFEASAQQEASATPQPAGLSGQTFYTWVGTNWNSCSVQCGGGTQTRNVSCQNSNGDVVGENLCSQPKPATSQSCQTQACTSYFWMQSGFSPCSKSCGGGMQTQTVTCSSDKGQAVSESFCTQSKPATSQSCNVQSCPTDSTPSFKGVTAWARIGLGEPIIENAIHKSGWSIDQQIDRILKLHPRSFRLWIPSGFLYDANGHRVDGYLPLFRRAIERLENAKVPIMGMDHSFPTWMTGASAIAANWNTIPCRDSNKDSQYQLFLKRYEEHWVRIARLFPEISMWEPANETNGREGLKPIQEGAGSCGKPYFSFNERVMITIELMERANRAIKSVSPNAIVFLPPPAPVLEDGQNDPSLKSIETFIRAIYQSIASWNGSARSYFDGVSWHPYIFQRPTMDSWVKPNEAIFQVLKDYGDQNVHVVFSEVGNSETNYDPKTGGLVQKSPGELAAWMQDAIRLSQSHAPWLSHIIWFRAFDDESARSWGGEHQVKFGIMGEDFPTLSAKPSADVFCKFAGCVDQSFRAWVADFGWSAFRSTGNSFCQYSSPEDFARMTGTGLVETLPWLAAIDPVGMSYLGACK